MNLKEGEMICSKCEGMGEYSYNEYVAIWCSKCQGTGKVDWIDNIVGKKLGNSGTTGSSGVSKSSSSTPNQLQVRKESKIIYALQIEKRKNDKKYAYARK